MHAASAERATRPSPEPFVDTVRVEAVATEGQNLHPLAVLKQAQANGALDSVAQLLADRGVGGDGKRAYGGGVEPRSRVRRRVGFSAGAVMAAAGADVEEVDEEEGDEEDEEEEEGAEEGGFAVDLVSEVGEMDRLEILGSHASSVVFGGSVSGGGWCGESMKDECKCR